MALQECVRKKILACLKEQRGPAGGGEDQGKDDWKVLVLDPLSTRMVSASCKMHEIMDEGITLVEALLKGRQRLPKLEAVYLITPCVESLDMLMNDFENPRERQYKCAHVYLTEACPDELFKQLSKASVGKYIKTLKEINIAFLPYESKIFSLDSPGSFKSFFSGDQSQNRMGNLERNAEQIATLCASLGEYPSVVYRSQNERNVDFAQLVQQKLDAYKADDPTMGDGPQKDRSQLIILDRGFDPVTPVVHELTFQAMAYDLLPIEGDTFKYESTTGMSTEKEKEVLLDESDDLWTELRHEHIAIVSTTVTKKLKEFVAEKRLGTGDKADVKLLSAMIKKMPQYQKELNVYSTHIHLAESCMTLYQGKVDKLCKVEQDLAMGTDADGEKFRDAMRSIIPVLLDRDISFNDKIRVIHLYVLHKGGSSEENFEKLLKHSAIGPADKPKVFGLQNLGVTLLQGGGQKKKSPQHYAALNRRERTAERAYQQSRWTPYLKDLIEDACADQLDSRRFPFLHGGPRGSSMQPGPLSARYNWANSQGGGRRPFASGPRLIFFIMGGMTYSEMRCAYEVSQDKRHIRNWEIVLGSTHILTPEVYLDNLSELNVGAQGYPLLP